MESGKYFHYNQQSYNVDFTPRHKSMSPLLSSYTIIPLNGQIIYRKTLHQGLEPPKECEVFIGHIPRNCYEDTLLPLFLQAGDLFEFRLMTTNLGNNRGFAFAHYYSKVAAKKAIMMFDNYALLNNWYLGVMPSYNQNRLLVRNICSQYSNDEIVRLFYDIITDIESVSVKRTQGNCSVLLQFNSHTSAVTARRQILVTVESQSMFFKVFFLNTKRSHRIVEWAPSTLSRIVLQKFYHIAVMDLQSKQISWTIRKNNKNTFLGVDSVPV